MIFGNAIVRHDVGDQGRRLENQGKGLELWGIAQ